MSFLTDKSTPNWVPLLGWIIVAIIGYVYYSSTATSTTAATTVASGSESFLKRPHRK